MGNSLWSLGRENLPSANVAVARLRLQRRDCSLAELEAAGLLQHDRAANVVRIGPSFEPATSSRRD